jgi:hypothetical protein
MERNPSGGFVDMVLIHLGMKKKLRPSPHPNPHPPLATGCNNLSGQEMDDSSVAQLFPMLNLKDMQGGLQTLGD